MTIKSFPDNVILNTRRDIIRVHLYTKFLQYGMQPIENDISMIVDLYFYGGYTKETQQGFFDLCLEKKYKKIIQSLRNTLSKYTKLGVLEKPKNRELFVSTKFIPKIDCDLFVLQQNITHADGLQTDIQGTVS